MPYLLLAAAGFFPALAVVLRRRDPALLATFFVATGLISLADWVVYGWFELYKYRTGLLGDSLADGTLGLFLGEYIFVPSLCVLGAAWLPGWKGNLARTALLVALEWLFLRMGLYEHQGWNVWWTMVAFPVYFHVVETFRVGAVRHGLAEGLYRQWFRASLAFLEIALVTVFIRAANVIQFHLPILASHQGNQSLGRFFTYALFSAPLGYWVVSGEKQVRPGRLAAAALAIIGWNYALVASGVQTYRAPWNPALDGLTQAGMLWVGCRIDDWVEAYTSEGRARIGAR